MNSLRFSAATLSATGARGGEVTSAGVASCRPGAVVSLGPDGAVVPTAPTGTGRGRGTMNACQITRTATDRETARRARRSISGYRIEAARVKRMAVRQAPKREEESPHHSMPCDGLSGVDGAGRMETASGREQGRDISFVCP